ncbi:MAG: glycosyltransferase family 4 protein [Bacteriovoracaceae bacterium]|nr:glycosyltransferase family 4 protein [Bacteriovoracaceae bacterium]
MKIGLIYSFKESNWFSVTKIVANLLKAYELDKSNVELVHINYSASNTHEENLDTVTAAFKNDLQKLIFIDHLPHPLGFLSLLRPSQREKIKEIIFHVFGDFTLNFRWWSNTEKLLKDLKVKFVCASHKQARLVEKFVPKDTVYVCPFPVNPEEFYFDEGKRLETRKKIGLTEQDFAFLYTGRLSEQKKSKELINLFLDLKLEKKLPKNCKLIIAGSFDNLGTPYLQENQLLGEYFRKTNQILERYPKELVEDVVFIGNICNKELIDYYNCSDRFISFSCYHDEDYGMSVAEALASGLPCLLTNWAGYSSFKIDSISGATVHIPVALGEKRVSFDMDMAKDEMVKCYKESLPSESRKKLSVDALKILSIETCGNTLEEINRADVGVFSEFSAFLHLLGAVSEYKEFPFMNENSKVYNDFYYKVYDVYAE